MRRTGPTNVVLRRLVRDLRRLSKKYRAPIWDHVADILSRPSRRRVAVNLGRINRYVNEGDVIVVPGKVLGAGLLKKKVTIAAYSCSLNALEKIRASESRLITIRDLINENPKGSGVKVIV